MLDALKQEQIVPFNTTTAYHFVPWIIALMVFLAILALSGAASVNILVESWQQSHQDRTQIVLSERNYSELPFEVRRQRVLEILKNSSQVASVDLISQDTVPVMLADTPAVSGSSKTLKINVHPYPGQGLDTKDLATRLRLENLGVHVEDFQSQRNLLLQIARSVLWISTLLATLIGLAAIITIAYVTHSGLEAHQRVINILNIIGAKNHFIAKQFQHHALLLSLKGGIIGTGLAIFILGLISAFMPDVNLLGITMSWPLGVIASIMVLTPLGVMALACFSAHLTVLSTLVKTQGQSKVIP